MSAETGIGYYIGLMSGTSLDGVDGVLAHFDVNGLPTQICTATTEMPKTLRGELQSLNAPGENEIHRSALAANAISDLYASVVSQLLQQANLAASEIVAIGAHGQTIRHRPELGYTTQLLAPALLVELTGICVIADLRSRDIAAGGQGAPLVPAFHRAVFGTETARNILNLGGIANVTLLRPDEPVTGFDTGPANLLLDLWCERHTHNSYDLDGQWAAQGQVNEALLEYLLESEHWFDMPPPKSTGRDQFNAAWLDQRLDAFDALDPVDVQATLAALTARTVTRALALANASEAPIFACGGGARNSYLMRCLEQAHHANVQTTEALGVGTQDMEALAFAWLAWAHVNKNAGNLKEVTGAVGARRLGACWPA